jgi:hypothetical protein
MIIRMMDEVLPMGDHGILLLMENTACIPAPGARLKDARGKEHTVTQITPQEDMFSLFIENGDLAYFERLFRDVRIDATAFELLPEGA